MRRNVLLGLAFALSLGCERTDPPTAPEADPPNNPANNPPINPPTNPPINPPGDPGNPPGKNSGDLAVGGLDGILLIHVDSAVTRLTSDGDYPSWSPDGKRLVYSNTRCESDWETYYKCEQGGLVILDMETRTSTVPGEGFTGEQPAWSPEGDEIAFSRLTSRGNRLFVMRLDGSPAVEIPVEQVNNAFSPSWSPDARRIAFFGIGGHNGVCIIDRDGANQVCLPYPGISPSWRPDGSTLAVTGAKQVVSLMAIDGSGVTPLTAGLVPAWSPDGNKLAFIRNNQGVWIADSDGTNVRQVATGILGRPAWRPRQ